MMVEQNFSFVRCWLKELVTLPTSNITVSFSNARHTFKTQHTASDDQMCVIICSRALFESNHSRTHSRDTQHHHKINESAVSAVSTISTAQTVFFIPAAWREWVCVCSIELDQFPAQTKSNSECNFRNLVARWEVRAWDNRANHIFTDAQI